VIWERAHQCLERLRHAVMCWGDAGVLIKYLDPHPNEGREERLLFDMGSCHNCRDFEKIEAWTVEHSVPGIRMNNLWWGGIRK